MSDTSAPPLLLASAAPVRVWREGRVIVNHDEPLAVSAGEVVAVVGANGAGKTAIMLAILGLLDSTIETHTTRIAYVPQRLVPPPSLPVTIADCLRLLGHPATSHAPILASAGIEAGLRRPMAALSAGELMRVMVAAACHGQPALLLLDEPTAALDAGAAASVLVQVAAVVAAGAGVVLVSHNDRDVSTLATRVVHLGSERL